MKYIKKFLRIITAMVCVTALILILILLYLSQADYTFAREVSQEEADLRRMLVEKAISHLDANEGTDAHHAIIDSYNAHQPLAQGYTVTYEDNWCATFVSCAAIECDLTDIIPTECSCQRQIGLWTELDRWEESDTYLPLPGDIIYYDWDVKTPGDSTGWSDHVGIVVGTHGPFIKVIEGNKDDTVTYRYIIRFDPRIRGYGLPEYV